MRPAVTSEAPDGSSMVVSDLRTRKAGTTVAVKRNWFSASISVTSVATRMLIRPAARTTGWNTRDTPNGLKSTPIWQDWTDVPGTTVQFSLLGTGISPPAVNFALSPEIAVRVGS